MSAIWRVTKTFYRSLNCINFISGSGHITVAIIKSQFFIGFNIFFRYHGNPGRKCVYTNWNKVQIWVTGMINVTSNIANNGWIYPSMLFFIFKFFKNVQNIIHFTVFGITFGGNFFIDEFTSIFAYKSSFVYVIKIK